MKIIKKHIASYRYAVRGIWLAFRFENNMIFHFAAAFAVVMINFKLDITRVEWMITLMLIGLAWMAEMFNTSIEKLADSVTKDHHPLIQQTKDLASGAVLVICLIAAVCGIVIYFPYLW